MNEAERYYEYLLQILGVKKQIHVAQKLGVSQPTVAGWLRRNAVNVIRDHIANLGFDLKEIDEKIKNHDTHLNPGFLASKSQEEIREEWLNRNKQSWEIEKAERLETYAKTLEMLTSDTNGFTAEFQYAFWLGFEKIKEEIFEGFNEQYWDGSTPKKTWTPERAALMEEEFVRLLNLVVQKSNLLLLNSHK